jgi:hypothetical protein
MLREHQEKYHSSSYFRTRAIHCQISSCQLLIKFCEYTKFYFSYNIKCPQNNCRFPSIKRVIVEIFILIWGLFCPRAAPDLAIATEYMSIPTIIQSAENGGPDMTLCIFNWLYRHILRLDVKAHSTNTDDMKLNLLLNMGLENTSLVFCCLALISLL